MRSAIFASMLAFGLAACGSGGNEKAIIVEACLEDGSSDAKTCDCMADQFVDNLDPAMLKLIVESSKAEDQDQYMMSKMGELTPEQMTSFMTVTMSAATECGLEM